MKVRRRHDEKISTKSCRDTVVAIWRDLGSPAVGARELTQLHGALAEEFGLDAVPSPARIARELAQEGAALRHPEIIESDARWRESQMAGQMNAFESLRPFQTGMPLQLKQAAVLVAELEALRVLFVNASDEVALADLKTVAIEARQAAKRHAQDESLSSADGEVQTEISEWFRVWLQTPNLFGQWLELRRSSAAFKEMFGNSD